MICLLTYAFSRMIYQRRYEFMTHPTMGGYLIHGYHTLLAQQSKTAFLGYHLCFA